VNQVPGKRISLIYLAPFLHLCACLIIAVLRLESGWHYMTIVDVPASTVVIAMLYDFDHPLILFGVIGTLWWFLLSLAVAYCWKFVRSIRSGS
jgi:hypothetical protein